MMATEPKEHSQNVQSKEEPKPESAAPKIDPVEYFNKHIEHSRYKQATQTADYSYDRRAHGYR